MGSGNRGPPRPCSAGAPPLHPHTFTNNNILCYAMLCYGIRCCNMQRYAMLCHSMQCYAASCYTMLCHAMLHYAVLCYAIPNEIIARRPDQTRVRRVHFWALATGVPRGLVQPAHRLYTHIQLQTTTTVDVHLTLPNPLGGRQSV